MLENILNSFFNPQFLFIAIPEMLTYGLWNTLLLAIGATLVGLVLGLILAAMSVSNIWPLVWIARIYTDIFRGLPEILTILLIGQGLAPLFNKVTHGNPYPLAILALSLISAAYIGEIFRSGIQSVETGQMEAGRALGMTFAASMFKIVIPQGIRRVLPALVNQFIAIIKSSSLVYFLGLATSQRDLFRVGQDAAVTYANLSPLVMAGIFYLIVTIPLTYLVNYLDKRLREGKKAKEVQAANEAMEKVESI
ncbi:amino acid ABC transporter permease [Brevibacterium sp. 50QC2O2]|uniref:amino acid ABC transporter permease n=1 Tax=Brevibacterium sp. 50QC2O2 TaxID=2968459 RepID=UPI00211BB313|nr:amino acid ABC transporter permease [Brevibacterium sp. 50QC2O2]MCQ9389815.1 amino acid ABC transporter permease [Brevibacterium sp. 50QC2O2]